MRFAIKHSYIVLLGALLASQEVDAQQWWKSGAPRAEVSEMVGNSTITISYSQPTVNWRKTWGKRVPFNKNWTLGNNEKTTITFEEDVKINNLRLGAGTYGFYVYPVNHDDWQLVFSKDATGTAERYDKVDDILRISVRPEVTSPQKQLKMGIENIEEENLTVDPRDDFFGSRSDAEVKPSRAYLFLHWERRKASLHLLMTGERRGMGLNPTLPENAAPAWTVVESSLAGLIAEDFAQHTRDFSDDFVTNFGDGGSTEGHIQMLGHAYRSGGSEGITINLEEINFEIAEDKAMFKNIVVYFPRDRALNFSYVLQKRGDAWQVTKLLVPGQQGGEI